MSYQTKILEDKQNWGLYTVPYKAVNEGGYRKFYDSSGTYVCQTNLETGIGDCTRFDETYMGILSFLMTYQITWDVEADSNTVKVKVLDEWKYSVRPTKIGTFLNEYPFNPNLSFSENWTPKEDWHLYFQVEGKEVHQKISEWLALSETEQKKFLGIPEPKKTPTGEGAKPPTDGDEKKGLAALVSNLSNTQKWLWALLASALVVIVSVLLWLKKRAKKAKEKTEVVAMKYGKYSQDIVDMAA